MSAATPSVPSSPTVGRANRTPRPGPPPPGSGRCWWLTTCGSPPPPVPVMARPAGPARAARALAAGLRGPAVRSLGFPTSSGAQVSFNVIDPASVSLAALYDAVAAGAESMGCAAQRAELVGLAPAAVLASVPAHRWPELDLSPDRTIESRLE